MNGNRFASASSPDRLAFLGVGAPPARQFGADRDTGRQWPDYFNRMSMPAFMAYVVALAIVTWLFLSTGWQFSALMRGFPAVAALIEQSWSLNFSRLDMIAGAVAETLGITIIGSGLGIALALPLALPAIGRSVIRLAGAMPDLAWVVIFAVCVGPGPLACTLTIAVCTFGFCGYFFQREGVGRRRSGSDRALIPAVLSGIERAVRSAAVIGLIGGGGIGHELKVAMDRFEYLEAASLVLIIVLLVMAVEKMTGLVRYRRPSPSAV